MKDRERSRSRYRFCGHPVVFLLSGVRMAVQARGAAPPAMPNIIVILSDDFGWGSVI